VYILTVRPLAREDIMKNVTISVEDQLLESSRDYAHRQKVSLNKLIRNFLQTVSTNRSNLWVEECFSLMDKNQVSSKGKKWRREEIYDI
jgi:hypothetical protein